MLKELKFKLYYRLTQSPHQEYKREAQQRERGEKKIVLL